MASDFNLFERVDSVSAAIETISHFYRRYHSLRHVEKKLVIRLTSEINHSALGELYSFFADILTPGGRIYLSGPLPEEADEPHIANLPRLVLDFNQRDFGRLRSLINLVNDY